MSEPAAPRELSGRIPELDGLRGMAIGMVLVFHYFQLTWVPRPGSLVNYLQAVTRLGWSGVDLFFVLSGFLIGGILLDARTSTNYFRIFYTRRFFRIVPIYAAVLLLFPAVLAAAQRIPRGNYVWLTTDALPWYSYWTFTQNFWMAHAGNLGGNNLAITWSLAIEEQFYLTLPLLVRFFPGRRLTTLVLTGIFAAPIFRVGLGVFWQHSWVARFVLMPCRADALLLGVLAAILLRDVQWKERMQRSSRFFAVLLPVFLLGIAAMTIWTPSVGSPAVQSVGYTWLALFYVSVLLYVFTRTDSLVSRALRLRWLGWLGGIAYGTYLLHQMIQGTLFGLVWRQAPVITGVRTFITTLTALFSTLVIARLSWRYFEHPLVKMGHRSGYKFAGPSAEQALPSAPGVVRA